LAWCFFAHGAQKALGWFGGYGFSGTWPSSPNRRTSPPRSHFWPICAEFLGGIGLILGFLGRVAAFWHCLQYVGGRGHGPLALRLFRKLVRQSKGRRH